MLIIERFKDYNMYVIFNKSLENFIELSKNDNDPKQIIYLIKLLEVFTTLMMNDQENFADFILNTK